MKDIVEAIVKNIPNMSIQNLNVKFFRSAKLHFLYSR